MSVVTPGLRPLSRSALLYPFLQRLRRAADLAPLSIPASPNATHAHLLDPVPSAPRALSSLSRTFSSSFFSYLHPLYSYSLLQTLSCSYLLFFRLFSFFFLFFTLSYLSIGEDHLSGRPWFPASASRALAFPFVFQLYQDILIPGVWLFFLISFFIFISPFSSPTFSLLFSYLPLIFHFIFSFLLSLHFISPSSLYLFLPISLLFFSYPF